MRMRRALLALSATLIWLNPPAAVARPAADSVLVLGALHDLHAREPAFDYDDLREAIVAFAPDVLVLEVRPDELAERKGTPGRPEYPAVIWQLLAGSHVQAVAMEPGGETFTAITTEARAALDAFRQRDPDGAAALSRLDKASQDVLLAHWQSAGQSQDETTTVVVEAVRTAQFALAGPAFAAAQSRWDTFMSQRALEAVRSNPGKRVMVIASYRNRALLERAVRDTPGHRVIEATSWFEDEHLNARDAAEAPSKL